MSDGKILCGTQSCDTSTHYCCRGIGQVSCRPKGESCGIGGLDQPCDTHADCGSGLYCCGAFNRFIGYTSISCKASCGENDIELCDPAYPTPCHFGGTCEPSRNPRLRGSNVCID